MKAIYLSVLLLFAAFGCATPISQKKNTKPLALVSVPPFRFFAEKLAGDFIQVEAIVPAGASSHHYEPSPQQVTRLENAVIWFQIGDSFEKKITPVLLQHTPKLTIFDLRTTVPLISYDQDTQFLGHGHHCCSMDKMDPHIWLSPRLAKIEAQKMKAVFAVLFPEKEQELSKNLASLEKELDDLDQEIRKILAPVKNRALLVSHPAFGYLCQEYGFTQISVEHEGKDPLPQDLQTMLEKVRQQNVQIVLLMPQYNNKGAKLIAEKLHLPSAQVNPYAENYVDNLKEMALIIAQKR